MRIAADAHSRQYARAALTGDVLGVVSRYSAWDEFDLRMSQDTAGVRLEIWNYNPGSLRYRLPLQPVARDTLWQAFRFAAPVVVMAFKDASDCVQTYKRRTYVH